MGRSRVFKVSSGDTLPATDVDWQYAALIGPPVAGQKQTLRPFPNKGAGGEDGAIILDSDAMLSSIGQGGTNTAGITGKKFFS